MKKSRYAQKQKMKQGSGKVYSCWMWWHQADDAPPRAVTTAKPQYGDKSR